jgi:hypothetical protein
MRPTSQDLAMRDPALAYLMGAVSSGGGHPAADFGDDADFGYGFGWDYGAEAAAPPAPPMAHPGHPMARHHGHHPEMIRAWNHHHHMMNATQARASLLDPNEHSLVKIERYSFSVTNPLVLATPSALVDMTLQPNTRIRPQRVLFNAPAPNFVLLSSLQVANVNVFVGDTEDAATYSPLAQGVALDLPTLDPANRLTVTGNYTGFVPPGYANGFNYTFIATFQGPSTIAGGGGC